MAVPQAKEYLVRIAGIDHKFLLTDEQLKSHPKARPLDDEDGKGEKTATPEPADEEAPGKAAEPTHKARKPHNKSKD
jgi:hypothetical protein